MCLNQGILSKDNYLLPLSDFQFIYAKST